MEDAHRTLLIKEHDELNAWGRQAGQIYFMWFTFFVTLNGAALALMFNVNSLLLDNLRIWRGVCFIFAAWSTTATISSLYIRSYFLRVDTRLKEIYSALYKGIGVEWETPQKNLLFLTPAVLRKAAFFFNALATFWLIIFWTCVAIFPPHRRP